MNASYPVLPPLTVLRHTGAELRSEPDGLTSTVENFSGYYNDLVTNNVLSMVGGGTMERSYLSRHPDFPSLLAYGIKIVRKPGVVNGQLTIEYRGLDPALSYPPPPIYTIETTTGNEPIATHPHWTDSIAGTATHPLNGAQFVSISADGTELFNPGTSGSADSGFNAATAVFKQWLAGSIFSGVEDYLAAGIIFRKTYTTLGNPGDASSVGTFSSPDGPAPSLPSNYDWFFLGITSEDNAGVFRNEACWKAVPSGPAADIIYGG